MPRIIPHLWFDTQAAEAAEHYTSIVPDSTIADVITIPDTPTGDTEVVYFELQGQPFMAISAGPLFDFNPSVSFLIECGTADEVDRLWSRLGVGGNPVMPLGAYPFSERYGWTEDRYGLSWQIMLAGEQTMPRRITPSLMFVGDVCGRAAEATRLYTSVFPRSELRHLVRYERDEEPDVEGTVKHASFLLADQGFAAMDSARVHGFSFNEAISFVITCDTQDEIDHYWRSLSAVPEAEQCGWLKDPYGLSWQVLPSRLDDMLRTGAEQQVAQVTEAFLKMTKFDIGELERAYAGADADAGDIT